MIPLSVDRSLGRQDHFSEVLAVVERAKRAFRGQLERLDATGGMTQDVYVRYLSFQYHLTKGVQRHFMKVAGHPSLSPYKPLREFLFKFAIEEEPHYKVAEVDLDRLGEAPLPCPLDVALWWAYFDRIVEERPFVRLGATCVLENLGAGAGALGHDLLARPSFLTKANTRFVTIHFHESLPHGAQILEVLQAAGLDPEAGADLVEGANIGSIMYLRLSAWATKQDSLTNECFAPFSSISRVERGHYLDLEDLVRF